jgi:hypothetical protein
MVHHPMHQVVLVVELVEASTLSTLSARKIMRSDNFKSYRLVPRTSPEIHEIRQLQKLPFGTATNLSRDSWSAIFRLLVTINTR